MKYQISGFENYGGLKPKVGYSYCYTDKNNKRFYGKVVKIARVRSGAVLAYMDNGKGFPVTKYGTWERI